MKTALFTMAMVLTAHTAMADGFVCQTVEGDLTVKIYNNTDPAAGTRTGAVMVLSDPAVGDGRKTIARFTDLTGNLETSELVYTANVDLRFSDSNRKGEYLVGTRLGEVDTIEASIHYSYSSPSASGESVDGRLVVAKRNGDQIVRDLSCTRYLKGGH